MAETFLYSIVGRILGELSSPVLQRIGLPWGFKTDLKRLKDSISTIKAVLLDAEEKKTTNHEVRDWLKKLEAAIYVADDVIDDLSTKVKRDRVVTRNKRAKKVRIFFSLSNQIAFRYKMGCKVKEIRRRLDDIAADRIKFHLEVIEMRIENKKREETHSFVPAEEIIGRERDRNAIIEYLLNSDFQEDVVVVSIVGIGGLGKTALAQLAYNDEEIKKHFQLRMWVCVSNVFDVKLVAQNIIEAATGNKCNRGQMDGVKDELGKQIDGKKYLLVLDDVWNEDPIKWKKLRELLMGGARGSKILLTTRTELVAKIMSTVSPYLLKGLSEIESWSLFQKVAFKHGVEPESPTMVAIGKEIVKKCVGVPLAIRTVGGSLYIKDTEEEWLHFKDVELSKIDQIVNGIFSILKLSYDYLPSYLKRCFAYCSIFPKDHFIRKDTLIQLWIAQGFIQLSDEWQRLEDVGDVYFKDLLRRSFFQDVSRDEHGNIWGCKMHDLINDLAQLIAGSESCTIGGDTKYFHGETRHVFIKTTIKDLANKLERFSKANKLRTFILVIRGWTQTLDEEGISWRINETISSFKQVRALELNRLWINEVPNSISELGHLRYLNLSRSSFRLLPECICRLHNLETLILNDCVHLKELPKEIRNLVSLRHLEIDGCSSLSHMPSGLGELTSLQTLTKFVVDSHDRPIVRFSGGLSELEGLVNLRGRLSIENLNESMPETKKSCPSHLYLDRMEFLEELDLHWSNFSTSYESNTICGNELFEKLRPHRNLKRMGIYGYYSESFPSWMTSGIDFILPNLVQIVLWGVNRWQHVTPLGCLPSLRVLRLYEMDNLKYIYEEEDCDGSGEYAQVLFPFLKALILVGMKQLKGLERRRKKRRENISTSTGEVLLTSSFGLHWLSIKNCPQLFVGDDATETQCLTTLQYLDIHSSTDLKEWIGKLRSLHKLEIWDLKSMMTSLPTWMCSLTTLQELIVHNCSPKLYHRCRKEGGEDWPKITHIPHVTLFESNEMAETFLYSIAGKILEELSSPALQRIGLLWGFKTDLKKLEESVSTIKAVLLDAEEKKTTDHKVRDWLKKLEAAIYDADDVIDDLSTQFKRHRVGGRMAHERNHSIQKTHTTNVIDDLSTQFKRHRVGGRMAHEGVARSQRYAVPRMAGIDDFPAIYDADDVIDDLSTQFKRHRVGGRMAHERNHSIQKTHTTNVIDDLSTQFKRHRVGGRMAHEGVARSQRCAVPRMAGIDDFPAIYDADDVRSFSSTKSETGSNRFDFRYTMGRKVKEIRERLDDIAADRIKFHFRERLDDDETRVENKKREETHSFVPSNI